MDLAESCQWLRNGSLRPSADAKVSVKLAGTRALWPHIFKMLDVFEHHVK